MTIPEGLRYLLICGGLFVLGFNMAVIWHAAHIVRAVFAWRLFMTGKSLFTIFVLLALWDARHDQALTWRVPVALAAITVSLISLFMLDHSYRRRNGHGPLPAKRKDPR